MKTDTVHTEKGEPMNIYLPSGYLDIRKILNFKKTFNFIVGGRAIGKTYGALLTAIEDNHTIMFMRRTQSQADMINKSEFSPFKAIEMDKHIKIDVRPASKYNAVFTLDDRIIGYSCALSTISNLRGFDASDVDLLIYDEFISEPHERPLKNEGAAFLNAYETMNRNRELKGKDPIQCLFLANAFNIANPLFLELGLVGRCEKMKEKHQSVFIDNERSVTIIFPDASKISERKKKTALYKLTKDSSFNRMALSNDFVFNPTDNIQSMSLVEFKPVVTVGEITIYKHKSGKLFYVSEHRSGNPPEYKTDEVSLKRFISKYGYTFYQSYMLNRFRFENMLTKSLFECYII